LTELLFHAEGGQTRPVELTSPRGSTAVLRINLYFASCHPDSRTQRLPESGDVDGAPPLCPSELRFNDKVDAFALAGEYLLLRGSGRVALGQRVPFRPVAVDLEDGSCLLVVLTLGWFSLFWWIWLVH
jgi:hypothetical protein